MNNSKIANRTVENSNTYVYDKYTFLFNYQNGQGSPRRIIYATYVYAEDYGADYGDVTHYWNTSISLFIKYEYYSFSYKKWYPLKNEPFNWRINYHFLGAPSISDQTQSFSPSRQDIYTQGNFTNGLTSIILGRQTITSYDHGNFYRHSPNDISWDFEITGGIYGCPQFDDPNGQFIVGNFDNPGPVIW